MIKQYAMINAIKICTQLCCIVKEGLLKRIICINDAIEKKNDAIYMMFF